MKITLTMTNDFWCLEKCLSKFEKVTPFKPSYSDLRLIAILLGDEMMTILTMAKGVGNDAFIPHEMAKRWKLWWQNWHFFHSAFLFIWSSAEVCQNKAWKTKLNEKLSSFQRNQNQGQNFALNWCQCSCQLDDEIVLHSNIYLIS